MRRHPLSLFMLGGIALAFWQSADTQRDGQTLGQQSTRAVTPRAIVRPTSGTPQSATPRAVCTLVSIGLYWTPDGGAEGLNQSGGPELLSGVSRNNILHVRNSGGYSIRDASRQPTHDYDDDLLSGKVVSAGKQERHGVVGVPVYATPRSPDDFSLVPGSPGVDAGVPIPNVNDCFQGQAPDMGACEAGAAPLEFGVDAYLDHASRDRRRTGTPQ